MCIFYIDTYLHIYIHTYLPTYHYIHTYIPLHTITYHYIPLHTITYIHTITLHYIALHYITLHSIPYHTIHTYRHTYHYIPLHTITYHYIHTYIRVCAHQGQSVKNWQFAKLVKWLKDYVLLFWVYEEVSLGPRSFGTCVMPQTCHALGDRRPLAGWSNGHLGGQNVRPRPPISVCKHLSSGGTQVWCRPIWT